MATHDDHDVTESTASPPRGDGPAPADLRTAGEPTPADRRPVLRDLRDLRGFHPDDRWMVEAGEEYGW